MRALFNRKCAKLPPLRNLAAAALRQRSFQFGITLSYRPAQDRFPVIGETDMNKNILIGLALVVAAGLGYYQFSVKPAQEAATMAAEAEAAAAKVAEEAAAAAKKAEEEAAAAAAAATAAAEAAAAAATDAAAALDPAMFDAAKIGALIDGSALDDATKATLKAGIDAAATNAALIPGAIAAVKTALGM